LAANIIAENLYSQGDPEGIRHVIFSDIIDHQTNGKQLSKDDAFVTTSMGTKATTSRVDDRIGITHSMEDNIMTWVRSEGR
jgi:hypothetical protein